jgi:predicted PurR-regulated permease PerM
MESVRALFTPLNPRRAILLAIFTSLILVFRHLLVLFVFFVAFERALGSLASLLQRHARVRRPFALLLVVVLLFGGIAIVGALATGPAIETFRATRESLPDRIAAFRQTALYTRVNAQFHGLEGLVEAARTNAARALGYLSFLGHLVLYALIGFILAVVYLFEQDELDGFEDQLDPGSLGGTLLRWLGYAADAISVTLQFQLVVAACNAVLTWPVLWLVGIPNPAAFAFMVFVSGMVPVVGNFLSGAILTLLAYQARGWTGVVFFIVLTFVLHKLESYYLNPRLAARHVRLPGFVLIVSLILWEHLLGFVGLFVSFPFLYLAQRIRAEFHEVDMEKVLPIASGA